MKKILLNSFFIILTILFTGCQNKDKKEPLQEVSIVLDWYPNAVHAFIYDAVDKGYFKDEGLKLKILFPSNSSDPLTLTAAKKADMGIYYLNNIIMAKANENIPIKSFGTILQRSVNTVISLKKNNILSPKDFQGKIAGTSGGPLSELYLSAMMKNDGVPYSSVKMIDVGFDILTSMITNQVDFTIGGMLNHEVPVMEDKNIDINYFPLDKFGVPQAYELLLIANEDSLKNNSSTYKKIVRALKRGFNDMKNNPDAALDLLLTKQEADQFPLKKSVEKQSMNILLPIMETKNAPFLSQNSTIWNTNINWLYDNKIINKKLPASDFFINLN
ncbi:ABC transporter substrate-binding protein [uncultured Cetobacterium sp.]|uniref:ABC transporter substrate-binding protein n=1 Tax=uncultured Cetobacterium sp. TaxID=527638 RepID=UPI002632D8E1|nr:ABC transporter substrate-binding protein [uncultured Cetobacterium sp.]